MANITGTSGDDTLTGTGADDHIDGLEGNDLLNGGGGTDVLVGGIGNDGFIVDSADDQALESAGQGNDTVYAIASYALAAGQSIEVLGAYDRLAVGALTLTGNSFAQTIIGNAGDNVLNGGGGTDLFYGLGGNDTYYVDSVDDGVFESAAQGNDTVSTSVSYALAAGQEIEMLVATDPSSTSSMSLYGNELANEIHGNAGVNLLVGGGGADALYGGGGNDIYFVDSDDVVTELTGQGSDTIYTTTSYSLTGGTSIEVLSAFDRNSTDPINLTGNGGGQTIIANAGENFLTSGGFNGSGTGVLYGLRGDDSYLVTDSSMGVSEFVGEGNDRVYTTVAYALNANSEIEYYAAYDPSSTAALNMTGNNLAQTIVGNAGVNFIRGGGGTAADTLQGLGGDDGYFVSHIDDRVIEQAGDGVDTVYAASSNTLVAGSEIEVLTTFSRSGTTAFVLTGNELSQTVIGNAGNNVIDGGNGGDFLYGLGGADTFKFSALGIGNADRIGDFVVGSDRIGLDSHVFTGLAPGALPAGAFVLGTSAQDADDRIIYDQATGHLFFDADGSNSGVALIFATLGGAPALTSGDFVVI